MTPTTDPAPAAGGSYTHDPHTGALTRSAPAEIPAGPPVQDKAKEPRK